MASTHVSLVTAGGTSNRRIASSLYGYCQTAANTVAKTVSLYTGNGTTTDGSWAAGDLFHGLTITVRFRYSNTATNPTLNVNSTGAKRIYKYGTTSPGITPSTSWESNSVISLTYDTLLNSSGCWVMNDHLDDTTGGGGSVEYTLSGSGDDDEYTITATPTVGTATSATIPAATTTDAGVMTANDKTTLDSIGTGTLGTTAQTIIPAINELNDRDVSLFKSIFVRATGSVSAGSNSSKTISAASALADLPGDYKMIAINTVSFSGTYSDYIVLRGFNISNSGKTVTIYFKSTASSSTISYTIDCYLMCVRGETYQ